MSYRKLLGRNRWFVLGLLFLGLNSYAVYLYHGMLKNSRGVRVEFATPKDARVAERDLLRWRFSGNMVLSVSTGAWSSTGPVKFAPDVKGSFCWALPHELVFQPDGEWKPCTDFKAVLDNDLRSVDFRPLAEQKAFSFHSDALALKGVSQVDYSESEGLYLQLEFSAEVAPDQVRTALSITNAAGENIAYRIERQSCGRLMDVKIPNDIQGDITLNLRAGLQGTAGPRGLEHAVAWKIKPARELRVTRIETDAKPFGPNSVLVAFNRPVLLESAAEFVKVVEPSLAVSVEAGSRYSWRLENAIRLVGDFKPNRSYAITLQKGLPGSGGTSLAGNVTRTAYFPDAEPDIEITASGNYMSPQGNMLIPFRTIGMTKYHVTVRRVYPNNLVYMATRKDGRDNSAYYGSAPDDGLAQNVVDKEIVITKGPNEIVEHRLALRDLIGNRQGAFYVTIRATNGRRGDEVRHHVIVSDTGLSARKSDTELLVWANSIRTMEPVTGAAIKVYSAANQEILSGTTDSDGLARLPFETNAVAGAPYVVTAQKDDEDITYLSLAESGVEVKGGIGDRPFLTGGYEACLFTDRGIYRPGETAHLKAIVRGKDTACPAPFPVQLNIYRPDNRLEKSLNAMLTDYGTAEFAIAWPDFAGTGNYRLELTLPGDKKALGSTRIAVEEFVPPQIRVEVKAAPGRSKAGEEIKVDIRADYLFGRPAAGLMAETRVEFMPEPVKFPGFPGFEFGDARKQFKNVQQTAGKKTLGDSGQANFSLKSSPDWRPPAAIKALILGTVVEVGGRSVTAYSSRPVDIYPYYIGLKRGDGEIDAGKQHAFEVVTVNPAGTATAAVAQLRLTVEKLTWTTVLKKGPNNTYNYCSEQQASQVLLEKVALNDGKASVLFTPASDGEYRLALSDPASGASSALEFHASVPGQRWNTRSMESPNMVELKFDKEKYAAGETAILLIKAPFTGKALVTLESTRVLSQQVVVLDKNTAELKFPVKREYAPNVYCAITLIRPAASEKMWGQHRALGLVPLVVDAPEKKASLSLAAADKIRPQQKLDVDIEVTDGDGRGLPCEVVVAAVDEGICMLTGFKTPDPYAYFMEPRLPEGRLCDIYSLLMPELEKTVAGEASAPGGDVMAGLGKRLNPIKARRFKPVALWSSTVMTDADGQAEVRFDVPEFTGQLRLMAVAVDKQRFATAEKQVAVVRPLVVQSSLPRFLAPADSFSLPVQIMNETGADGEAMVRVACAGPVMIDNGGTSVLRRIVLEKGAMTNFVIGMAAGPAPGKATCLLDVEMAGEHFAEEVELAVRPPAGRATLTGAGRVAQGEEAKFEIPAKWLEQTGEIDIWLSSLPAVELGGSLSYLLQYPYGCLEQTTSKSFPLLYLSDLAAQTHPGWLERKEVANFVNAGIQRILTMQRGDGSFSLWCGCDAYTWGSIYATHFLVEAGKAGYNVPDDGVKAAGDYLERWMAQKEDHAKGASWKGDESHNRAYACYVLALAGRPQHGWMIRLREQEAALDRDTQAYLAAALIAAGKRRDGNAVLGNIEIASAGKLARQAGGSLRSNVREDAMLLTTWLEVDPENPSIPGLVKRLESRRENGRWYNTQENAMALMALGKYCNLLARDRKPIAGQVGWRGMTPREFNAKQEYHASFGAGVGGQMELRNGGDGPIYYYWKSEGVPVDGKVQEEDRGLKVRRELLDLAGNPLASDKLQQGELLVVEVTVDSGNSSLENVVVEDLLPAGLEIENANLKTSEVVSWCKDKQTLPLLHTDVRDDRMVAFTGWFCGKLTYFYAVRAVTPGEFAMPAILATCMYDPAVRSVNGAGRIRVVAP